MHKCYGITVNPSLLDKITIQLLDIFMSILPRLIERRCNCTKAKSWEEEKAIVYTFSKLKKGHAISDLHWSPGSCGVVLRSTPGFPTSSTLIHLRFTLLFRADPLIQTLISLYGPGLCCSALGGFRFPGPGRVVVSPARETLASGAIIPRIYNASGMLYSKCVKISSPILHLSIRLETARMIWQAEVLGTIKRGEGGVSIERTW
jgi:hypothetical protein